VDDAERVLLVRFEFASHDVLWATPGGGIEPGEPPLVALRRELDEEVGLRLDEDPPHVWHHVILNPGHAAGYDGVINDFYLIRTGAFEPRGSMTDAQLEAENVFGIRWWPLEEIRGYAGTDRFGPRDLGDRVASLLAGGPPSAVIEINPPLVRDVVPDIATALEACLRAEGYDDLAERVDTLHYYAPCDCGCPAFATRPPGASQRLALESDAFTIDLVDGEIAFVAERQTSSTATS
jgi:8-oxo-dGTP diphosphatase